MAGLFRLMDMRGAHPEILRRAFLRICAIQCTHAELGELQLLRSQDLELIAANLKAWTRTSRKRPPALRAICFGAAATADYGPESARSIIKRGLAGIWSREDGVLAVRFSPHGTIEDVILHETAHALMDHFCRFFPFPLALQEGFACRAQMLIPNRRVRPNWLGKGGSGRLLPEQYLSIRNLLLFDYNKYSDADPRIFAQAFSAMTRASYWLAGLLLEIGRSLPYGSVLPYLGSRNIREPREILKAICMLAGLSEEDLEARFRQYCVAPETDCGLESRGESVKPLYLPHSEPNPDLPPIPLDE